MKKMNLKTAAFGFAITTMTVVGCERSGLLEGSLSAESTVNGLSTSARDMNQFPMHKVVCDPWGGGVGTPEKGIRGRLGYKGAAQSPFTKAAEYLSRGQVSPQNFFFSELFVPTRMFDQGFATQTSQVVKDDAGAKLIEYFGLEFQTDIRLNSDQTAGSYEFALLADDGVTMQIGQGDDGRMLIKDDGDHETNMACGEFSVPLNHQSGVPIKLNYFQGPRYHIALTLLYRPTSAGIAKSDPLCGHRGNDLYFDPNTSAPRQAYKDLLARGWQPVPASNFYLPGQQVFNPCVEGDEIAINNFKVLEVSSFQAQVSWNTSRPGSSQVLFRKLSTGEETLTDSDNMMRMDHNLIITGLESDELYEIQAVSVAEDGGKALGPATTIKTP